MQGLALVAVELEGDVEPEGGSGGEQLADLLVDLALGAIELRVRRRRAGEPHVLAEVHRHPAAAPDGAGADPDDLPTGRELIQPGGRVGAEPARQNVALPDLGSQRDPPVAAPAPRGGGRAPRRPAGGRRRSARREGSGRARGGRRPRPPCAAPRGWRGEPAAARRRRTTRARSRRAAARRGPRCRRARARAAPSWCRRRSGGSAGRSGRGHGCARSDAAGRPMRRGRSRGSRRGARRGTGTPSASR